MGAYTMSGKYDLLWKRDLSYQGEFWSVGATYGYSFPLGKRFKLELSASLGFMSIAYRHYIPSNDYGMLFKDLENQGRISYFGPTKLKASLVLPLYLSYQKKGGAR